MLALNKKKPYKAYIKRFKNGFGIKTVNIETKAESIVMITTDESDGLEGFENKQNPLSSHFSKESIDSQLLKQTCSIPHLALDRSNLAISKVSVDLLHADTPGLHIYEEDTADINLEETSVIYFANTKLAKENGVHVNIPGKLMRVCSEQWNDDGKIEDERQPSIKPLTIVVGDYVIYLNICHEPQSCSFSKETQTNDLINRINKSKLQSTSKLLLNTQPDFKSLFPENLTNKISTQSLLSTSLDSLPQNQTKEMQPISKKDSKLVLQESMCESSFSLNPKTSVSNPNLPILVSSDDIVDDKSDSDKTILKSETSLQTSLSSNVSFEICSKVGRSNKSVSSVNKYLSKDLEWKNSIQSQFCSSQTRTSLTGKELRSFKGSEISLKQIKERLNTVTFSLQQLKSVIEIMDSSENCAIAHGYPQQGGYTFGSDDLDEELESDCAELLRDLCDRCGLFYSKTQMKSHSCYSSQLKPISFENRVVENCRATLSAQNVNKEVFTSKRNEKVDCSNVLIVGKESSTLNSSFSNELLDLHSTPTSTQDNFVNNGNNAKLKSTEKSKNLRKNYFKFIANRLTQSESFKTSNQLEVISSEKLTGNIDFPAKKFKYIHKGIFKSLGNILYLSKQIKTNIDKPIDKKDSTKIIELFTKPTSLSSNSMSLHVMPSSTSSDGGNENYSLQPEISKTATFECTQIQKRSCNHLESPSNISYGLQHLFLEEEYNNEKDEQAVKLKRKKMKSKRKFNLFCFKI